MRKLFAGIGAPLAIVVLTVTSAAPASADCGYTEPALSDSWCDKGRGGSEASDILQDVPADNTDVY